MSDKGARLVIDGQGNCIMDGAKMSVNDAMEKYDERTSRVLVFDNDNKIILASGLPKNFLGKKKHQFDIKLIDKLEIEKIIPGRIQGGVTLENEGIELFNELDKQFEQLRERAASNPKLRQPTQSNRPAGAAGPANTYDTGLETSLDDVNIVIIDYRTDIRITSGGETRYLGIHRLNEYVPLRENEYSFLKSKPGRTHNITTNEIPKLMEELRAKFGMGVVITQGTLENIPAAAPPHRASGTEPNTEIIDKITEAIHEVNQAIYQYNSTYTRNKTIITEHLNKLESLYQNLLAIDYLSVPVGYRSLIEEALVKIMMAIQEEVSRIGTTEVNMPPSLKANVNRKYTKEEIELVVRASIVMTNYQRTMDTKDFFLSDLMPSNREEVLAFIRDHIISDTSINRKYLFSLQRILQDFIPATIGPNETEGLYIPTDVTIKAFLAEAFTGALTKTSLRNYLDLISRSLKPSDVVPVATAVGGVTAALTSIPFGTEIWSALSELATKVVPPAVTTATQYPGTTVSTLFWLLILHADNQDKKDLSPQQVAIRRLLDRVAEPDRMLQHRQEPHGFGVYMLFDMMNSLAVLGYDSICRQTAYAKKLYDLFQRLPTKISNTCTMIREKPVSIARDTALQLMSREENIVNETLYGILRDYMNELLKTKDYNELNKEPYIIKLMSRLEHFDDRQKINARNIAVVVASDIAINGPGPQHVTPDSNSSIRANKDNTPSSSFDSEMVSALPQEVVLGPNGDVVGVGDLRKGADLGTANDLINEWKRPTRNDSAGDDSAGDDSMGGKSRKNSKKTTRRNKGRKSSKTAKKSRKQRARNSIRRRRSSRKLRK
jgi:hypothetical protein